MSSHSQQQYAGESSGGSSHEENDQAMDIGQAAVLSTSNDSGKNDSVDDLQHLGEEEKEKEAAVGELFNGFWQRDPERERDKILGFFVMAGQPIPRDIFHLIMSFVPAFPFYFNLRSVCSQWLYEFQEQVYGNVTYLNLVDDGMPKYYFRKDGDSGKEQLVQFKPIDATGKRCRFSELEANEVSYYNRTPIFEFLANVFPNVKHLRLGSGSFYNRSNFKSCVKTLLSKLTQLETLDVLGTKLSYFKYHYWGHEVSIDEYELELIARSLPNSTKNLNFIGVCVNYNRVIDMLKIFSEKGRSNMTIPLNHFVRQGNERPITVDIQRFTLSHVMVHSMAYQIFDWEHIKEMYLHFEISLVEPDNLSTQDMSVVSYVDYLNHMSKEGIFLSHMGSSMRTDTNEIMETTIDIAVREYPHFQPLLSRPELKNVALLSPCIKLNAGFVFNNVRTALRTLELLIDPDRMKYPDLIMHIDSTFEQLESSTPGTLLSTLIANCSNEEVLTLIKTIIEDYKPSMSVNGVRNYLVEVFMNGPYSLVRSALMKYLLSIKPELVTLGDIDGIIHDERKDLPLLQLFLSRSYQSVEFLEDFIYLVRAGASLTQLDTDGNNILHSACNLVQIDLVRYLVSVCPENLIFERNKQEQTPIELIFCPNSKTKIGIVQIQFLEQVSKLPCFKNRTLQSYKTSCGTLLHSALRNSTIPMITWLLRHGFEANTLNDKGENALFYSTRSFSDYYHIHRTNEIDSQRDYVNEHADELIKAGAQVDLENNKGGTIVTSALHNSNYELINIIVQNPSISSKPLSRLLSPRMQHGINALHFLFRRMVDITESVPTMNRNNRVFHLGAYPVARHCALLCLEQYPEMLYERSEQSIEDTVKDISGVSPLQILLEASRGLKLLSDLSIKLDSIANKPVFSSKDPGLIAPIPVLYLALKGEMMDVSMFDKLMAHTVNLLVRDETQETKPNLLHIAAEKHSSLCQCIIKHWKKKYKNREELSKLISMPLEKDSLAVEGRKPRNAALIACTSNQYEIFAILWPFTKPFASQFDCPVQIALERNYRSFALSAVMHHRLVPSKDQLHQILRSSLVQQTLNTGYESKFVSLMIQTEDEQPKPSWLEILMQAPPKTIDPEERAEVKSLSTLQLIVSEVASYTFNWLVEHYADDPLLDRAVRDVDIETGNTLLHSLTSEKQVAPVGQDLSSILSSIVNRFKVEGAAQTKLTKRRVKLPSLDHLNTEDLTQFVNIKNKIGRTCLHNVAVNANQVVLRDLLLYGANTEIRDSDGYTALELMRSDSAINIVQKFIERRDGKKSEKKRNKRQEVVDESDDGDDEDIGSRRPRRKRRRTTNK